MLQAIGQGKDLGNKPSRFRAKQDTEDAEAVQAKPHSERAPLGLVDEEHVRPGLDRQGDRLGLTRVQFLLESTDVFNVRGRSHRHEGVCIHTEDAEIGPGRMFQFSCDCGRDEHRPKHDMEKLKPAQVGQRADG